MIELLVTLVIIGVLTAIAVPLYSSYLVRGQRATAKAALLQTAQAMERYYTACGTYATPCNSLSAALTVQYPLGPTVVANTNCNAVAPPSPATTTYCIQGIVSTSTTATYLYQLTAAPCGDAGMTCGPSSNGTFQDPGCDQLTIDNTGNRGVAGSATLPAATCWQQ